MVIQCGTATVRRNLVAAPQASINQESGMSQLRIFSYLPNPRVWKALIAARLCGIEVELRGAPSHDLKGWLWDFDARPLSEDERQSAVDLQRAGRIGFKGGHLFKSDAFLATQPFATVPAAFSPDGSVGIFESNSIMRVVARLGHERLPLDGRDPYEVSRIDSFLDVSLVFGRDAQLYLFALLDGSLSREFYVRTADAFATYMSGIDRALQPDREFLVGGGQFDACTAGILAAIGSGPRARDRGITEHAEHDRAREGVAIDCGRKFQRHRHRLGDIGLPGDVVAIGGTFVNIGRAAIAAHRAS
jgi:elongation factor 1-gamma